MAPRNTWLTLSGGATTYQSYQAWVIFIAGDGRVVILAQLVPVRRHRYATVPAAPKTYAVAGGAMTRSTSRRVHPLLGAPGSATGAKATPPLVETNSPSAKVARISAPAPP